MIHHFVNFAHAQDPSYSFTTLMIAASVSVIFTLGLTWLICYLPGTVDRYLERRAKRHNDS